MANYIIWLVGAILITHNFGNIMTVEDKENVAAEPETQEGPAYRSRYRNPGLNNFSIDLYEKLSNRPENLVCSSISVGYTLAALSHGAGGETENQIKSALQMDNNLNWGRYSYQALANNLQKTRLSKIVMASKIYLGKDTKLNRRFQDNARSFFRTDVENVDFSKSADAAAAINSWAGQATDNRIKNLVNPEDVQDAQMVLVNAFYHKALWMTEFNAALTKPQPFHVDETTTKDVDMMYTQGSFGYGTLPKLDAVYIQLNHFAWNDEEMSSMFIILPNTIGGLKKVEESLRDVDFWPISQRFGDQSMTLSMPKFRVENTIVFNDFLTSMGISDLFTDKANFTGIADVPLKVSKVIQKAAIEVSEGSSEASAGAGDAAAPMAAPDASDAIEVKVDRPFAFVIHNYDTDTILFQGHVINPSY